MNRLSRAAGIVVLGLAVLGGAAAARPVSLPEAAATAARTLASLGAPTARGTGQACIGSLSPLVSLEEGSTIGYVAMVEPQGYVVLSADTRLPAVIAYSFTSDPPATSQVDGTLFAILLHDLAQRTRALEMGLIPESAQARAARGWDAASLDAGWAQDPGAEVVGPLLEAPSWSQEAPWNDACPDDPATGEASLSGCVATAMGQLFAYWRYPTRVSFLPSDGYRTRTRGIAIDAQEADLTSITYAASPWRNPSDQTMSDLVWAAGVSVRMDYTSAGSGARLTDAAVALAGAPSPLPSDVRRGVWGYASADVRSPVNASWGSPYYMAPEAFYNELRADLLAGRPVLLCIAKAGTAVGHVLICDGYDSVSGAYHLNLGWGGVADAWYVLPEDVPGGYNVVEYGVLHIFPGEPESAEAESPQEEETPAPLFVSGLSMLAFPNPTRGDVEFLCSDAWKLQEPTTSRVDVYSLAGDLVWQSDFEAGSSVIWDGVGLDGAAPDAGVYVCIMTLVSGADSRRVRTTLVVAP